MSGIEKAIKKYFKSDYEINASFSNAGIETAEQLDAHYAKDEQKYSNSNFVKNASNKRILTTPKVKLDPIRLKAEGIVILDSTNHKELEEYRYIKRPLLNNAFNKETCIDGHGNLVMITSSVAGEGKTYTSINLALSIARELDKTVLLIDADPYHLSISRMFGIENYNGLTDVLIDSRIKFSNTVIKAEIPNLSLLPAGREYPNVTELMASETMRRLAVEIARQDKHRIILFDSPPLLATSESRVLAELMGQIIFVVESGHTSQSIVKEAISHLNSNKAIGLILNKSQQNSSNEYYYGYYGKGLV